MWRIIPVAILQGLLLSAGQLCLKMAMNKVGTVTLSWSFVGEQLTNWWWLVCGLCFMAAGLLYLYMFRHFPMSVAYPVTSLSYVFGMLASVLVLHETVTPLQWVGTLLILAGCYFIIR